MVLLAKMNEGRQLFRTGSTDSSSWPNQPMPTGSGSDAIEKGILIPHAQVFCDSFISVEFLVDFAPAKSPAVVKYCHFNWTVLQRLCRNFYWKTGSLTVVR